MTDEHTHFEAVTYPEAMTLQARLAALPPYLRTTAELSQATGYTSLGMLREWQNKALLARNAALCEALRMMRENAEYWALRNHYPAMSEGDFKTWHALSYGSNAWLDANAVLAACEVKP